MSHTSVRNVGLILMEPSCHSKVGRNLLVTEASLLSCALGCFLYGQCLQVNPFIKTRFPFTFNFLHTFTHSRLPCSAQLVSVSSALPEKAETELRAAKPQELLRVLQTQLSPCSAHSWLVGLAPAWLLQSHSNAASEGSLFTHCPGTHKKRSLFNHLLILSSLSHC